MAQQLGKTLFNQGDLSYIEIFAFTVLLTLGGEHGDITKCAWIFRRAWSNHSEKDEIRSSGTIYDTPSELGSDVR
jgi:hypothetical protein